MRWSICIGNRRNNIVIRSNRYINILILIFVFALVVSPNAVLSIISYLLIFTIDCLYLYTKILFLILSKMKYGITSNPINN